MLVAAIPYYPSLTDSHQDFFCLLYTSDAADELDGVDLGGRRIIKKKFFQAEDGIRDQPRSRGLGDVYKRQPLFFIKHLDLIPLPRHEFSTPLILSLIHI